MPQLMPLFWIFSSIIGIVLIMMMMNIYGKVLLFKEYNDFKITILTKWFW